jgi:DNA-binding transcriptional LysR family regulator
MINEQNISCFLTLAETLSFTETARQMYMTQQSVSKHIARLEEDLAFPLFVRTHHYVTLTAAGERLYSLLQRFKPEYMKILDESRLSYRSLTRTLRVGYLEWLDFESYPMRAFAALRKILPEIELVGERHPHGTLGRRLLEQKLDLIVTYEGFSPKGDGLKSLQLAKTPLILLVSPDHPKAAMAEDFTEFINEPFLCAAAETETPADSKQRAKRDIDRCGLQPSEIILMPNRESVYTATQMGQGISITTALSHITRGSGLKMFPTGGDEILSCFWRSDEENAAVAKFAKCLQQAFCNQV